MVSVCAASDVAPCSVSSTSEGTQTPWTELDDQEVVGTCVSSPQAGSASRGGAVVNAALDAAAFAGALEAAGLNRVQQVLSEPDPSQGVGAPLKLQGSRSEGCGIRGQRIQWEIDVRKLSAKGSTVVSPAFRVSGVFGAAEASLKLLLEPVLTLPGAALGAEGRCRIAVKCDTPDLDLPVELWLSAGGLERRREHNFARRAVCRQPEAEEVWDLSGAAAIAAADAADGDPGKRRRRGQSSPTVTLSVDIAPLPAAEMQVPR
eukprot:TRINITY_DN4034_c0_g2_i1.p1 TRINITY_DN4034_c0_g2~~TRINITY_DN4034_c0_g2_i1.p1  ORF type:complete len:287 (+),score=55.55 TRINITY_DN4034_c0_g2_i1:80-862(+)